MATDKPAAKASKNKLLKLLPKAASAVHVITFQNPPFSPGGKLKAHGCRGFSGPIIPAEARRKAKSSSYETPEQEPTSPKVSCMGQIKQKHQKKKMMIKKFTQTVSLPKYFKPIKEKEEEKKKKTKTKKKPSTIMNMLGGAKPGRKSDASADKPPLPERAPSLSQMKRFASGRDKLANFDWTAQIAPVDSAHRNYYSDEERGESDGEEEEVIIPFSAPILASGRGGGTVSLEPRKEINLWKRRTMSQPRPLQLDTLLMSH